MATTEMAVRVSVADVPIVTELVLASADMLHALENEYIPHDTAYQMGYTDCTTHVARFQRFKAAVLAFRSQQEQATGE